MLTIPVLGAKQKEHYSKIAVITK